MCVEKIPIPYEGERWGLDNGAYGYWIKGLKFNESKWLNKIDKIIQRNLSIPYLATLPDIVGGGNESLELSLNYLEKVKNLKWNWYLCVQDGMDIINIPIELFSGIFLGGTNKFKSECSKWLNFAKLHNKKFHYGRCGTRSKVHQARLLGCDSVDSNFGLYESWKLDIYKIWTEEKIPRKFFDA